MRAYLKLIPTTLILIYMAIFGAGSVHAQPGSRLITKIKAHPRTTIKFPRRAPVKDPRGNTISMWVVSNPANSKVSVNGEPRGETDAGGDLELQVIPGTYTIRVSREGYLPRESEVEVLTTPAAQQVEFTLPSDIVALNVVTDPPEVEVYLDDVYKGATGSNGLLVLEHVNPSQAHTLRVRKDGYVQQATPITSYSGQISIKLLPDATNLKVTTDPPEAEVYLDEVYKGTSTSDGTLVIEQVNPNQSHTVRAKKDGHRQQSASLSPGSSQLTIKLSPDPIVLLVREIKRRVADGSLVDAVASFNQLAKDAPDHQELPRLSESILLSLQSRTTEMLKRVQPNGLAVSINDIQELSSLYDQARTWRPGDEAIGNISKYWLAKLELLRADRAVSLPEKENLRRSARLPLLELSDLNLRNPYLVFDLGWSWWKLNEKAAAQKQFKAALELRPEWAYPYFAMGFLSMNAADNEKAKSAKVNGYAQALENFTKAISLKSDFVVAYALKSIIYGQLRKSEDAIANGLQAVAVDPQSAYAHFALGHAYFEKGKSGYRNSLTEFERAIALGGADLNEGIKNTIQLRLAQIKRSLK